MTRARCLALLLTVAAGCGDDVMTLHPVVDLPPKDNDAYPLDSIDELLLSVAESGHDTDIQLERSSVDNPPSLSGVPFGDDLVLHLSGAFGGVELAYGRSCSFAVPDDAAGDVHLYFSRIVKWGQSGQPLVATRTGGYSYALDGGARAVFIGGDGDVTDVELFDARSTGSFALFPTSNPDGGIPSRRGAVLAPFGDGRAILVGGVDPADAYLETALLVDATGAELQVESQADAPMLTGHAAATLVDGSVVVAGGRADDGVVRGEAWSFTTTGGALDPIDQLPFPLTTPRADHTMTRLGSEVGADVLVVGGRDDAGQPVGQAEIYRPLSETFVDTAAMLIPRWGHSAVRMPGGFVLVIGGLGPDPVTTLELYDPVRGVFADAGEMPAGAGLTQMSVSPLPDGRVLLVGGLDETGTPVATTYIAQLDPIDGRVIVLVTDSMATPRAGHSAVQLCDGTILVVGGTDDRDDLSERYNPRSAGRR